MVQRPPLSGSGVTGLTQAALPLTRRSCATARSSCGQSPGGFEALLYLGPGCVFVVLSQLGSSARTWLFDVNTLVPSGRRGRVSGMIRGHEWWCVAAARACDWVGTRHHPADRVYGGHPVAAGTALTLVGVFSLRFLRMFNAGSLAMLLRLLAKPANGAGTARSSC